MHNSGVLFWILPGVCVHIALLEKPTGLQREGASQPQVITSQSLAGRCRIELTTTKKVVVKFVFTDTYIYICIHVCVHLYIYIYTYVHM